MSVSATTDRKHADWASALEDLARRGLRRHPRLIEAVDGRSARIDGREVLLMCSNDYLGLANDPRLAEAAKKSIDDHGFGSGASRLISGTRTAHTKLEEAIADFKGTEAALVFGSGYMANVGVISSIVGHGDSVLSDELNHASLIDGCRMSGADIHVYPHADANAVRKGVERAQASRRRLIVTDGVFSMDGDMAPLQELCDIADSTDASVLVDDAHGTGVVGPNGRGVAARDGVTDRVDAHVGTFSKALGGYGAFVAGSAQFIELLLNKARSFVFSTAPPPATAAAALAALDIVQEESERREHLLALANALRQGLSELGYQVPEGETPIIPIMIGDVDDTMRMSEALFDSGIFVQGIRPPTVPKGTARLRLTVTAAHTERDIERALDAFAKSAPLIAESS